MLPLGDILKSTNISEFPTDARDASLLLDVDLTFLDEGEWKALGLVFRIAALGLSVAAAVVMGTASQLVIVDGRAPESLSSYSVSYSQYNALRYELVKEPL